MILMENQVQMYELLLHATESICKWACYFGTSLSAIIAWRLFRMEKLTLINKMFFWYFFCDVVFSSIETYFLFKLYKESELALSNPKGQIENCLNFLGTRWVWSGIRHLSQGVMVFIRFAYVRFASGLIKDRAKLLHILALVFFAALYSISDLFFFYYFFYRSNYKDLKMVFCTKQNITLKLDTDFIGSSVKPKMMLIFTTLLFLLSSTFFWLSAIHSSKRFAIRKISTNLLDLKLHYGYAVALIVGAVLVDQGKHILLEIFYWRLGPNAAFHIWLLVFLLENLGLRLGCNMIILSHASRRLPELSGYRGRRFPGQPPPAPPRIAPRRLQLPPTFAQDEEWRRIGARRHTFLDLGLPRFGTPRRIMVETVKSNRRFAYLASPKCSKEHLL